MKKLVAISLLSAYLIAAGMPSLVTTTQSKLGQINSTRDYIGTLYFKDVSNVASQSEGVIEKLHFEIGDNVKIGDVLATIDSDLINSEIEITKAQVAKDLAELEQSQKDLARYKKLIESNSISSGDFDKVELAYKKATNNYKSSQASLKLLQIKKEHKIIKSPFDGVVLDKKAQIGGWIQKGGEIGKIANLDQFEILIDITQDTAKSVKSGEKVTISVGDTFIDGYIHSLIPQADMATKTVPLKIVIKNEKKSLIEGLNCIVSLPTGVIKEAIIIPRDAVIKRFGGNMVFAVIDNSAVMFPVTIISFDKEFVAVESNGLTPQMDVVIKGNERIFPKQPVKVIEKR